MTAAALLLAAVLIVTLSGVTAGMWPACQARHRCRHPLRVRIRRGPDGTWQVQPAKRGLVGL